MQNAYDFVSFYRSRNLVIMPLKPRTKSAFIDDWEILSVEELFKHFDFSKEYNIGLRLDGLICLDLERRELWDAFFLQPLEAVTSKTWVQKTGKGYHVFFRGGAKPFKVDGLAEIRSGHKQYVVVAPSIHPETGKPYEWISDIEKTPIAEISDDDLKRLQHKLELLRRFKSFIEAMVECWKRYHRHHLALWVSGCLRKMNSSLEDAEIILKTIVQLSQDEESSDRIRCLQDTFDKPLNKIKAWSGLKEELLSIVGSEEQVREIVKTIPVRKSLLFEVKSLKELVDNAKEINYISYPLLPSRSLIVLAGKGGVGKSLLSLYIAHCVTSAKRLFDYYDTKQARVLLIDNENNPSVYKKRVELLNLNPIESVDIINFTNWRLDKKGGLSRLKNLILSNGYELIILDNWTTLTSMVEENKPSQVSNILTKLRKIAYETGCSILLIHHLRKGLAYVVHEIDELRGSSVLVNEPDLVLLLELDRSGSSRILKTLKNRLDELLALRLLFQFNNDGVLNISAEEITPFEADNKVSKIAKSILKFFTVSGKEQKAKEIIKALPYPRAEIYRAINYLIALKAIERVSRGLYRPLTTIESFIGDKT